MITLNKFADFVKEINKENGRLYKEEILNKYKDDEVIKYYLDFVFNPYIVTGISTKKLSKAFKSESMFTETRNMKGLMEYLKKHNSGTDVDIRCVQSTKETISDELKNLFDDIITKRLTIGCDVKTINKIMPGLIPTFNVQLANKYYDNPSIINGKKFAITTKIDGGRIIAIKDKGLVKFYTRQGQQYEGLVDLEEEMLKFMPDNTCLDGEITVLNKGSMTSKEQYKETMKITRAKGEKHGIKMLVFDMMTAEEFYNQACNTMYSDRRAKLDDLFNLYDFKYFNLLSILYEGTDTTEIDKWVKYNVAHGEEGAMLNVVDAPYDFKRTNNLLKCKLFNDVDLEIIGFEAGTGKYKDTLGAVIVNYKGNPLGVGSGFSDDLRKEVWEHRDEWLGRTIVVKYFEETQNAEGKLSLRFPVYIDYRTDK